MRLKLKSVVKLVVGFVLLYSFYSYLFSSSGTKRRLNDKTTKLNENDKYEKSNEEIVKKREDEKQINEPDHDNLKLLDKLRQEADNRPKNGKKDWHNYAQIAEENQRQGPGEQGQGNADKFQALIRI